MTDDIQTLPPIVLQEPDLIALRTAIHCLRRVDLPSTAERLEGLINRGTAVQPETNRDGR